MHDCRNKDGNGHQVAGQTPSSYHRPTCIKNRFAVLSHIVILQQVGVNFTLEVTQSIIVTVPTVVKALPALYGIACTSLHGQQYIRST